MSMPELPAIPTLSASPEAVAIPALPIMPDLPTPAAQPQAAPQASNPPGLKVPEELEVDPMVIALENIRKTGYILGESHGGFSEIEQLLVLMAKLQASDCFISVGARIKLKIEGKQIPLTPDRVAKDDVDLLFAEALDSDQIGEIEKTGELNFAISLNRVGRFRASAFVQRNSKAMVIRYIPPDVPAFETLRLPKILADIIMLKRGLVLVVGPTGSGKSTTLASLIDHRNANCNDHILTIEDPVEFLHRHKESIVNQREVGTDTESFHDALRNAMRQAPDVILIGEIRDQETMRMAMQYAQSGHLVLATLHANNSYHALNRIVGFYPPDNRDALFPDLSSSLKAIIAQRLVPGFNGARLPAVEVLINSKTVQELISKGEISKIAEMMPRLSSDGTQTFEEVLVDMVRDKRISVETALKFSDSATNLYWRLSQEGLSINDSEAVGAGVDRSIVGRIQASAPSPVSTVSPAPAAPAASPSSGFSGFVIEPERL